MMDRNVLIVPHGRNEVIADDIARIFSQKYESVLYHDSLRVDSGQHIDRSSLNDELKQNYGKEINVVELHQGFNNKSPLVLYLCNPNTDLERYGWKLKEDGIVEETNFEEDGRIPWPTLEFMIPYSAYGIWHDPSVCHVIFGDVFEYIREKGGSLNKNSAEYKRLIKISSYAVSRMLGVPNPLETQGIASILRIKLIDRFSPESRKIRERKKILKRLNLRLGDRIDIISHYSEVHKNLILKDVFRDKEYGPYIRTSGLGTPLCNIKKIVRREK